MTDGGFSGLPFALRIEETERRDASMNSYHIKWHDIGITIRHTPKKWSVIDHIEVESDNRQQLPFTETGYKSHYPSEGEIASYGGPVEYVMAWLDFAADSKFWRDAEERNRQYALF